jgi:zinc protease
MLRTRALPRLLAAACLAAALSARAQPAPPAGVTRVASVEGITEYRLQNGLRALLFPDPSKPTITVNMVYLVGSRHENYGETGMAHIVEHLVSYGSPRHPDAKKEQADRGAQRNATTSFDRTNYFEVFPASDENLDWALDLESDRMQNAFVRKDILDSQMSVVRNEFEAGENAPQNVLFQRVLATAFEWHNYGKTTIGAKSDIENVPIDRLTDFYRRYYRPDNAVLIVAGKFEETKALPLLARLFAPLKNPASPVPQTYTAEPVQDGERSVVLRRVGDVQQVAVLYKIPAAAHPDSSLLTVAANVLAGAPSGRMYKALVDTKKAAFVGGSPSLLREPGFVGFNAAIRKDASLEEARDVMVRILDGIAQEPFSAEEVERAKAQLLRNIELSLTNSDQVGLALTQWSAAGDWRLQFIHRDRIKDATAPEVQRAALAYLKSSNRTVGLFVPDDKPLRAPIPATPDVAALVKDYRGQQALAEGEAFDPSPANIEKRALRPTLANGMKLVLLPKKTRGGTVNAQLRLHFGDERSLKGRSSDAQFAAQMLMRGSASRTRQQIQDELNRLKCQMNVQSGAGTVTLSIQTLAASLPDALRLAADVLRTPAFPAEEFEPMRVGALATFENQRQSPEALAQTALFRHLSPYPADDVRYVRMPEEEVAAIKGASLDGARKFHKDFYGASHAVLAVVGDLDPTALPKLAAELFGSWRSPSPYAEVRRGFHKVAAERKQFDTPDKTNAMFVAGQLWSLSDGHQDYPALVLANYMLGGHSSSRLYLRIRGKEGLSYGVGSTFGADSKEQRGQWNAFAITNPVNIDKVEAAFREEVERALKDGFAADEIEAARKGWLQGRSVQRSQDAQLAGRLGQLLHDQRTMEFDADLERKVAALTKEQCSEALRRYLDPAQLTFVRGGDFAKKPAQ